MIKKIFVFGDSISFGANDWIYGGWVVKLKNYFAKTGQFHHVFNLGVSGENSNHILQRMQSEIEPRKSIGPGKKSLLLIGIPINDTRIEHVLDGDPEISKEDFLNNLKKLHVVARENVDEFVFIGATNVDEQKTDPWQEVSDRRIVCWRNKIVGEYNAIAKKYCEEQDINFIEMFGLLDHTDLPDGLHPNEIGHEKMYRKIKSFLIDEKLIREI